MEMKNAYLENTHRLLASWVFLIRNPDQIAIFVFNLQI